MIRHRHPSARPSAAGTLGPLLLIGLLAFSAAIREGVAAGPAREASCSQSIPDIYDRVSPAVVSINAISINPYQLSDRVTRIVGSGVIIDPAGLILTNAHVALGRHSITVTLDDGTNLPANLVGADPIFDLAVLRIPPPPGGTLPTATSGDSGRVRVGEEVMAIGNPLGLEQTLTRGVVSSINRILPEAPLSLHEPLIQTDAPINPGNSGGPLVNRCGEVIGITTAIIPEAQNIGFAIPINLANSALPSLLSQGRIIRPWIGVQGQLVGPALRELLRLPLTDGLLVEVVEPGSPAERNGLRAGRLDIAVSGRSLLVGGDIVTGVNGTPLTSQVKLREAMRALRVGETVRLTVFRDGELRNVEYVLPERPVLPGDIPGSRTLAPAAGRGFPPATTRGPRLRPR